MTDHDRSQHQAAAGGSFWTSRSVSVFECFETVCGVIERSVQAHLG